jgi:hypothetical protein
MPMRRDATRRLPCFLGSHISKADHQEEKEEEEEAENWFLAPYRRCCKHSRHLHIIRKDARFLSKDTPNTQRKLKKKPLNYYYSFKSSFLSDTTSCYYICHMWLQTETRNTSLRYLTLLCDNLKKQNIPPKLFFLTLF